MTLKADTQGNTRFNHKYQPRELLAIAVDAMKDRRLDAPVQGPHLPAPQPLTAPHNPRPGYDLPPK